MPHEDLDDPDICSRLEKMRGKAMAKGMGGDVLGLVLELYRRLLHDDPDRCSAQVFSWLPAREEPVMSRFGSFPVLSQHLVEIGGQHDLTVFLTFPLTYRDLHSLAVDVSDLEFDHLRDPQARRIGGHDDGAILETFYGFEERSHLSQAEYNG